MNGAAAELVLLSEGGRLLSVDVYIAATICGAIQPCDFITAARDLRASFERLPRGGSWMAELRRSPQAWSRPRRRVSTEDYT
jgi:hypothetical protein